MFKFGKLFIPSKSTGTQKNYAFLIGELAENSYFKESGLSRTEFCKAILLGETNYSQISRYMKKYAMKDIPSFAYAKGQNQRS